MLLGKYFQPCKCGDEACLTCLPTKVIRQLSSQTLQFRVLALSATPGGDAKVRRQNFYFTTLWQKHKPTVQLFLDVISSMVSTQSVQAVISNLLISHIELRSEESLDIQAHSHQRSVDKVVVPLGEALSAYQTRYLEVNIFTFFKSPAF